MKENLWETKNWFVSPYNYLNEVKEKIRLPEKVSFHDITLRDGEQQAGIIFNKEDKIEIARKLDEAGVSRIEAGMPAVSKEEKDAVKAIANEGLKAKIFTFARCMKRDVDLALACDADGVIMEIPSSDHLIKYAYGWTVEKAINLSVEATKYAGEHGLHVAFFTIDTTRANFDTFWNIIESVASEGHMDSYVLVDTFGVCSPEAISYLVKEVKKRTNKPVEMHCHNDFGLAIANSLAGVIAGAEIVHTTVNAIGERSGNAALEEMAASLEVLYGLKTGVNFKKLRGLSKLVEELSLVKMPPHKPIVGDNVFTTESGIIAGWWDRAKDKRPLEVFPFNPDFLGFEEVKIALGKGSGRASIIHWLNKLGLEMPPREKIDQILEKVKILAEEKKRLLTDEEFKFIVKDVKIR
ncbi:pyruvate carboxyltransferase [Candidatus Bathyarchaeota archaeon]|nr:pyruvate carboxyltransferase [Candidatus Bathyarchaeota archaeon]